MAKNKPKRKFRKYIGGSVDEQLALTTIGSRSLLKANFDETVKDRGWLSSVRASWTLDKFTKATDVGPIYVGLAHADYSAAEVEEWIEATGTWDEGDLIQQEVMKRKIRRVGTFDIPDDATKAARLEDGRQILTKCGWIVNAGQAPAQLWAYNLGQAAVATTVPTVHCMGKGNFWPT